MFQSWLEIFNLDGKLQSRSKISIPVFLFTGPSLCTEKGPIKHFNSRSITRKFQARRPRSNFFNPRPSGFCVVSERTEDSLSLVAINEERKTDKEKSHKGIWRSDAPEASHGQTRDVPGTPGTFGPDLCVNQN